MVRGTSSLSSHGSTTGRGCGTRAIKSRRDPSSSSTRLSTTTTRAVNNGERESSSSSSSSRASNREDDDNRATSVATATATIARAAPRAGASPPRTADAVDKLLTRDAAAAAAAKRRFDVTAASASLEKLARRYDWLSASLGALLGTSYGVYRGQPPAEALGLTLCATVVAVAIDEFIKDFEAKQK